MPLHKEDVYFIASVLLGHMPIGKAISWAFRKVRRAVRQRPQGDEEAGSDQERDDIREAIIEILQHLREIRQSAAGQDPQRSGGLAATTAQASGGLATTTTTTSQASEGLVTTTTTTVHPAEVEQIPSGHQQTAPEEQGQERSGDHDGPNLASMTTLELVLFVLREAREIRKEMKGTVLLFTEKNG